MQLGASTALAALHLAAVSAPIVLFLAVTRSQSVVRARTPGRHAAPRRRPCDEVQFTRPGAHSQLVLGWRYSQSDGYTKERLERALHGRWGRTWQ